MGALAFLSAGAGAAAEETGDEPTASETQPAESTPPRAHYTEREEKVMSATTGRAEKERVIEFKETEISGALARPIEIIIPRQRIDFDKITLTIYNNEPPHFTPEEYKMSYYRRNPVREDAASEDKVRSEFAPTGEAPPAAAEENEAESNGSPAPPQP